MDPDEMLRRWRKTVGMFGAQDEGNLSRWLELGGDEPNWKDAAERRKFLSESVEKRQARIERARVHERAGRMDEAYAVLTSRKNPSGDGMSAWEWLGLGTIGAVILYAVFKPTETAIVLAENPNPLPVSEADRAVIRQIQDQLRALGYNPGPTTGGWNHDTNYALAFFQRAEGLPATGILTGTTATRLALRYEQRPIA